MNDGLSYEAFAGVVSVCTDTLYAWEKAHPEFSDAKKAAVGKGRLFWEKAGLGGLKGTPEYRNFNSTVWVFTMKNRFKWHDNVQVTQDLNAKVDSKFNVEELSNMLVNIFSAKAEMKKE